MGLHITSKFNKLYISNRCTILHVNYTWKIHYNLVQETNLDLPLFSENQAYRSYIDSFLMTVEEQFGLSGSKFMSIEIRFHLSQRKCWLGHRATSLDKGISFQTALFFCLCSNGFSVIIPQSCRNPQNQYLILFENELSYKRHTCLKVPRISVHTDPSRSQWQSLGHFWWNFNWGAFHLLCCSLLHSSVTAPIMLPPPPGPCSLMTLAQWILGYQDTWLLCRTWGTDSPQHCWRLCGIYCEQEKQVMLFPGALEAATTSWLLRMFPEPAPKFWHPMYKGGPQGPEIFPRRL